MHRAPQAAGELTDHNNVQGSTNGRWIADNGEVGMGREARCMGEFGGWTGEGRLLLETDALIFRGAARWSAPLRELRDVSARDGWLEVLHGDAPARFDLGKAADRWAHAILNPRGLLDKLDVKATSRVWAIGLDDGEFIDQLRERAADVTVDAPSGEVDGAPFDLVLYRADSADALDALVRLRSRIAQNGGIWVISPRGRKDIADVVVMAAARDRGLVDVKVARFSETHTALKLVIPKSDRTA